MKRKLFKQMRAEWRANIWMALELFIVSVVIFLLADKIFTTVATVTEPLGFDSDNCYLLDINTVSVAAPDFVDYADRKAMTADLRTLLDRLRSRPEIEAAALSINAYPYNQSLSTRELDIDSFSLRDRQPLNRVVDPEFLRVFRIEGASGQSIGQLQEELARNKVIASDNMLHAEGVNSLRDMYGARLVVGRDEDTLTLHSSFIPMRFSDYSSLHDPTGISIFTYMNPSLYPYANELTVRVRENMTDGFEEKIMADAEGTLKVGNWYVGGVSSFKDIRDDYNRKAKASTRDIFVCAIFLLLNIFLGILGTFWFRTRQRFNEIALRKVCGAGKSDIFRRILAEGQILLLIVTIPAICCDYLIAHLELTTWYDGYFEPSRFFLCAAVAWALCALTIMTGSYFPAHEAMRISPAEALRNG